MQKKKVQMPKSLSKKLSAAICMLLISAIMMVSATYAWFTLSTAPEITGITTSVGANGNLEIALLTTDTYANPTTIASNVGDSSAVQAVTAANITWGNIVDLSDASYGSGSFVLNPARLNLTTGVPPTLSTPEYGSDGRVTTLNANTVTGTYNTTKGSFVEGNKGVRAIGVAAAMSEGTLALRNAVSQIAINTASAKVGIQGALNANGSKLASLAVKFQDDDEYAITDDDAAAINAIVTSINNAKTSIGDAISYALMAKALSESADASKLVTAYPVTGAQTGTFADAYTAYAAIPALETVAVGDLADDVRVTISAIMGNDFTINGFTLAEARQAENVSAMASAILSEGSIKVAIPGTSAAALAKVAANVGNVSANVTIDSLSTSGVTLTNVKANLATGATGTATMVSVGSAVAGYTAADNAAGSTDNLITDLYGYAVDFAFRTNAASSNLLLQQAGIQRIYADGNDASTQGQGSYMEFTKAADLNYVQFKQLLDSVRVVFTDNTGAIKAVANLITPATIDTDTYKATLRLVDYTISNGEITVTGAKANQEIMALTQNTPVILTATVYLDGDVVNNSMVSATSARSMTGTMNLQFASSATLVPMDYSPLHSMDATTTTTAETTTEPIGG